MPLYNASQHHPYILALEVNVSAKHRLVLLGLALLGLTAVSLLVTGCQAGQLFGPRAVDSDLYGK